MIEFHPLANIFPLIEGDAFDDLVGDVCQHGVLEPIVLLGKRILDGRNRYRAAVTAKVLPESLDHLTASQLKHFKQFVPMGAPEPSPKELLDFVVSKNLHRRQLDQSQRSMIAAHLANLQHGGDRTDQAANLPVAPITQETAAKMLNVSERSVRDAVTVKNEAEPELREAVEQGHIAVSVAAKAAALPAQDQREIAEKARGGDANAARNITKQKGRAEKEQRLAQVQTAMPDKRYGVVYADPEWRFETYSRETGMDRAADNHYPTSATDDICARPVADIAADDAALFLWATVPMMPDALRVMAAWGFRYVSHAVWIKDQLGTGYWFRNKHELLLVGTKGNIPAPAMGMQLPSAFTSPRGDHSAKPNAAYEMIERYFPNLPKIELNARRTRPGWDAWGNEAPASEAAE